MKNILFILLCLISGALYAQNQPVNFILIYRDSIYGQNGMAAINRIQGFNTVAEVNAWLNNRTPVLDSTQVVGIYNISRNKPLGKGYTEEEKQKVERIRERKWSVK